MITRSVLLSRSWTRCRNHAECSPGWLRVSQTGLVCPANTKAPHRRSLEVTPRSTAESTFEQGPATLQGQLLPTVGSPSSPFGRNLVVAAALDLESVDAFRWTLLNIYRRGDTLTILHIVPDGDAGPASGSIYYCPPAHDPEEERCLWSQARDFIEENFVELGRRQGIDVQVMLAKERHKGIGPALCKKAEELQASMLIMAAHNKSRFEEIIMGSTSKHAVAHCKKPVLLLH